MRRLFSRAALLLLTMMLTATTTQAQSFGGGSGTEEDPYIITTVAHMQELATNVNSGTNSYNGMNYYGKYFRLDADLDFSGATSYWGIGSQDAIESTGFQEFAGFFDGNGHVVRNLNIISSYSYRALFNVISAAAVVKNLTLASSSITGQHYVGGIVGYMNGNVSYTDRGVRNCIVADDVFVSGQGYVGGIVGGTSGNSDVIDCAFLGTVTGNSWVGAITGYSWAYNAYNNGNTSVNPSQHSQNCYIGGNCTKGAVGMEGTDGTDELTTAQHVFTIVYSEYVSGNIGDSSPKVSCNGKNYYLGGSTVAVLLSYSGPATTGYVMKPQYAVEGGTVTQTGSYYSESHLVYDDDIYAIVLPSQADAVVTVVSTEQKRDIGYEPWVSISIAPQQYTGNSLSPVVTIIDNMSGTPVTLQENTDYKITAFNGFPNPSFYMVGNHDVYIVGIGDFGGRATAVFNIYDPSFSEGSGTEDDPYIIRTTDDMDIIASKVYGENDLNGYHFRLAANLDYTGKTYNVIGNTSKIFRGYFDGNGYTISNVTSMSYVGDNVGLFGWIGEGAVVQNVHLSSSSMNLPARSRLGGIVGYNQGGTVAYCTVADNVTISGFTEVGGIVGYCLGGTIEACVNKANVTGRYGLVGGIAGMARTATGINNNLNFGAIVSTNGLETIGGITGNNDNSTLQNNYYAGSCTTGGIGGTDVLGQAMRGYIIATEENVFAQMMGSPDDTFTGITYDGIRYLGAGETTYLLISRGAGFSDYTLQASAGTLTQVEDDDYGDEYYSLTMPTEGQNVTISLATPPTLVLLDDDLQYTYDNAHRIADNVGFTGKVQLSDRTLYKDGKWNTLCLPFSMTSAQVTAQLAPDGLMTLGSSSFSGGTLTMTFTDATEITAGVPYIIKWNSGTDIENPVFTGVTISNTPAATETAGSEWVDFVGTYSPVGIYESGDKHNLYLGNSNTLYYPTTEGYKVNACRAYFVLKGDLTAGEPASAKVRAFTLNFGDGGNAGDPARIHGIEAGEDARAPQGWYTLDGRRLSAKPAKSGIYVNSGNKIVTK